MLLERRHLSAAPGGTEQAIADIERSVRQVMLSMTGGAGPVWSRRDVHPKHHGLVQAHFRVASFEAFDSIFRQTGVDLRCGVFSRPGHVYPAWLRFSSSSKRVQSDEIPDGRGLAIKLLGAQVGSPLSLPTTSAGPAGSSLEPPPVVQADVQDFLLLNGPAFFAKDAREMVQVARLEAEDRFPSNYFLSRPHALVALIHMLRAQGDSALDLTYFSQTAYAFGPKVVKYRVAPRRSARSDGSTGAREALRGPNRLRESLARDLALPHGGPPADPALAPEVAYPLDGEKSPSSVVLDFSVQLGLLGQDVDDATRIWSEADSPFVTVAEIEIFPQRFEHETRAQLAEHFSFNPFLGRSAHEPLGSINLARGVVYETSRRFRQERNGAPEVDTSIQAWFAERSRGQDASLPRGQFPDARPADPVARGLQAVAMIFPAWGGRLLKGVQSRFALLAIFLLWGLLAARAFIAPDRLARGIDLAALLPSEKLIPPAIWAPNYANSDARAQLVSDPTYLFRYGATGTEYDAGIPYWIYRALPRVAPEYFEGRTDYAAFGLDVADDHTFYEDYHALPRGVVLSDSRVHLPSGDLTVKLARVSFNCATCHRGEYLDESGERSFVDGMPNNVIDTVAFKVAIYRTLRDPRFSPENVISKINEVLLEEHRRRPHLSDGEPTPTRLTHLEELVYAFFVREMRNRGIAKPVAWIDERPENGPGRVDAFGALRYEFLGYRADLDRHVATVGLPSIWNQHADFRPRHHWDGNTSHQRARNFGAIVGVGGTALSIRKREVDIVSAWIERLEPPEFPFERADDAVIEAGRTVFEAKCAGCHGTYAQGSLLTMPECMRNPVAKTDTDPARLQAVDEEFIERLNALGERTGLWPKTAFAASSSYLCPPLDGVWARAPYLHNDSVPNLDALLSPPEQRPRRFFRGNTDYDVARGGFSVENPALETRAFLFRTQEEDASLVGNSSRGHPYLAENEADKRALIAYLLTL